MEGWITFWGWTLIFVLLIYTGVAVAVTIGGLFDIKTLLKALSSEDSSDVFLEDEQKESS